MPSRRKRPPRRHHLPNHAGTSTEGPTAPADQPLVGMPRDWDDRRIPPARPSTASATCGGRLDVGSPYAYRFSDVHLETNPKMPNVARVLFRATWLGPSVPGVMSCE